MNRISHNRRFSVEYLETRKMMTADLATAPESTNDDLEWAVSGSHATDEQDEFSIETETQYGSKGVVADGGGGSSTAWTCSSEGSADATDAAFASKAPGW